MDGLRLLFQLSLVKINLLALALQVLFEVRVESLLLGLAEVRKGVKERESGFGVGVFKVVKGFLHRPALGLLWFGNGLEGQWQR